MSIKENELPIAESLGDGDTLRIVDANGASKRVGADGVNKEPLHVTQVLVENLLFRMDKTFGEIFEAFNRGIPVIFYYDATNLTEQGEDFDKHWLWITDIYIDYANRGNDIYKYGGHFGNIDFETGYVDTYEELMASYPKFDYDM